MPINYKIRNTDIVHDGWLRHTIELTCDDITPNIVKTFQVEDYGKAEPMLANIEKELKEFSTKCLAKMNIDTKPIESAMEFGIMSINIMHSKAIAKAVE
jgi:hypothetical protein